MKIKGIVILILMLNFTFVNNVYSWYSRDPIVFDKLKGTAWEVNYHYNYLDVTDGIGFYDTASINSDGEASLFAWNLDGWPGMTLYGDLLIGTGYGFTVMLADKLPSATKTKWLMFDIDGNSLSGDFIYMNMLTEGIQTSKLYGHKIGDIPQKDKQNPPEDISKKGLFETPSSIDPNGNIITTSVGSNSGGGGGGCFIQILKEETQ